MNILDTDAPLFVWRDFCIENPNVVPPAIHAPALYAEWNNLPLTRTLDLGGGVTMEFTLIPPGQARLGDNCEIEFAVTQPYWISTTPVTQSQYAEVTGHRPSRFDGDDRPVERVSWYDAIEFCELTGTSLPREWQWEYACRSWSKTRYHWGDQWTKKLANCEGSETTTVGSYPPNPWGLYDMHGNVWEWCLDNWSDRLLLPSEGEQSGPFTPCVAVLGSTTPGSVTRSTASGTMPTTATTASVFASSSEGEQSGPFVVFVAAPGAATPGTVVRTTATGLRPRTESTALGSGSSLEGEQSSPFASDVVFVAAPGATFRSSVARPDELGNMLTSGTTSPVSASSSVDFIVLRGGSWFNDPQFCRSANRSCSAPSGRGDGVGFRVIIRV